MRLSENLATRRRVVLASVAALPAAWLSYSPKSAAADAETDPTAGRHMVFEDNFKVLNWDHWNAGPKATIGPSGFYGRSAFARRGGEAGFDPYSIVDDPSAEDGKALQIATAYIGRKMDVPNYYGNELPEFQWVSGNLQGATPEGRLLNGWRSGYFEARMRFPHHPLTWPAFWLLNRESVLHPETSLEVDIVEHKGWESHLYGIYLHEWGKPGEHHEGAAKATKKDLTASYNLYGMLIEGNRCMPYFNRRPVLSPSSGKPFVWIIGRAGAMDASGDVFFPLLTLALRNDVPYPPKFSPDLTVAQMFVDYFRVYQGD